MAKPLHINVSNKTGEFYVLTAFFGIFKKKFSVNKACLVVPDAPPINIFKVDNT